MVMHARKPPRINDGYFEKHQSHPYQNSKYGNSKSSYSSERSYDRMRDSPNGNSYRSDSPDSQSPRDRSYQSKSYLQKIRDKERDYKSRDKYSDCARSPKDKRSRDSRDSEYRSNHDRSNLEEKRDERDRVARVGDWSEHISSSGKKYYYNCKTEVSQWEKPRDWLDRERGRSLRDSDRNYSSSSSRGHDKHSSSSSSRSMAGGSSRDQGNKSARDRDHYWNSSSQSASNREEEPHDKRKHLDESQDMDISPGDSTPTSEYSRTPTSAVSEHHPSTSRVSMVNPPPITPQRFPPVASPSSGPPNTSSSMSLASLPRLLSQITGTKDQSELSPQKALQTIQSLLSRQASLEPGGSTSYEPPHHHPLKLDTLLHNPPQQAQQQQGPPTPTHSESQDYVDARKVSSPPSSLSSLQSLAGGSMHALRPQGPHLTPSLANFYRDDLVNHVRGLPADLLEKQAQKLSDEAYILGSLQCTKVSAELKTARSIVRLTEIQATLQEQRILFLRQQIKQLEELKSLNSFMSDS